MRVIYADNNATPRVAPEVYDAMTPFFTGDYFESSSTYEPARHTAAAIIQARSQTAERLEVTDPKQILFTSCALSGRIPAWSASCTRTMKPA
jgi:cysteine desulfurase